MFSEDYTKYINFKYGANSGGFGFGAAIEIKISKNITVGALYETISSSDASSLEDLDGLGLSVSFTVGYAF